MHNPYILESVFCVLYVTSIFPNVPFIFRVTLNSGTIPSQIPKVAGFLPTPI